MPTLNIGIDSSQALVGARTIRTALQQIQKDAKHTIILLSQIGKITSWRSLKTQLDSVSNSSKKFEGIYGSSVKSITKTTKDFNKAGKKLIGNMNDTVNTFGRASKQMNRFGSATKKSSSIMNTWIGKYSIVMSGLAASIFVFQNIILGLRKLVQLFNEFNDALGKLKLKLLGQELKNAEAAMLKFQSTTRYSITDYVNGIEIMKEYGATTEQAMQNIAKVSQFATVTQQKFGTAARELIKLLKREGLAITEINDAFAIYAARQGWISSDMEYMAELVENKLAVAFGKLGGAIKTVTVESMNLSGLTKAIDALADSISGNGTMILTFFVNLWKNMSLGKGYMSYLPAIVETIKDLRGATKEVEGAIPSPIRATPSAWIRPDMTKNDRYKLLKRMGGKEIDLILEQEQIKMKIQADMELEQMKLNDAALKEKERFLKELKRLDDQYKKDQLRTETSEIKERLRNEKAVGRKMERYKKEQLRIDTSEIKERLRDEKAAKRKETQMVVDKLRAYQSLYRDMQRMREHNFDFERQILKAEYNEYVEIFGKAVPELLEWFAYKQREILKRQFEEEGGFLGGIVSGMMEYTDEMKAFYQEWGKLGNQAFTGLTQAFEDSFVAVFKGKIDDLKDIWKNFMESMLDSFIRMLAKMATEALMKPIMVSITGAISSGGFGTSSTLDWIKKALGIGGTVSGVGGTAGVGGSLAGSGLTGVGTGGMYGTAGSGAAPAMGIGTAAVGIGAVGLVAYMGYMKMEADRQRDARFLFTKITRDKDYQIQTKDMADAGIPGNYTTHKTPWEAYGTYKPGKGYTGPTEIIGKSYGRRDEKSARKQIEKIIDEMYKATIEQANYYDRLTGGMAGKDFTLTPHKERFDIKNAEKELEKLAERWADIVWDVFEPTFKKMGFKSMEALAKGIEQEKDLLGNAFQVALETGSWLSFKTSIVDEIYDTISQDLTKALVKSNIFEGVLLPIYGKINKAIEKVQSGGGFDLEKFGKKMDRIGDMLDESFTDLKPMFDEVANIAIDVQQMIKRLDPNWLDELFSEINEILRKADFSVIENEFDDLNKWYGEQITNWKTLFPVLSPDDIKSYLDDINRAAEILAQNLIDNYIDPITQAWKDFIDGLDTSDLAPVQSMETFNRILKEKQETAKIGGIDEFQDLLSYVQGDYLPFVKAYGEGDYKDIYALLMSELETLSKDLTTEAPDLNALYEQFVNQFSTMNNYMTYLESIDFSLSSIADYLLNYSSLTIDKYLDPLKGSSLLEWYQQGNNLPLTEAYGLQPRESPFPINQDSFQHGTNYVPQTGSYLLHQGEAVMTANDNSQPREIHIHLEVDGRQIGYAVTKELRSNSELINAVQRLN